VGLPCELTLRNASDMIVVGLVGLVVVWVVVSAG
jgi:hypothetical protein